MRRRLPGAPGPSRTTSRGTAPLSLAIIVFSGAAFSPPAGAGWQIGFESNGRLLCTGRSGQRTALATLPDGEGGHLVVTLDRMVDPDNPPDGGLDIGLLRLDGELNSRALPHLPGGDDPCGALLVGGFADQRADRIAPLGQGRFLLAGTEYPFQPSSLDPPRVFAQVYDREGRRLLEPPLLAPAPAGESSEFPFISPDGAGGFFIGWKKPYTLEEPSGFVVQAGPILLQRYDADGRAAWPESIVLSAREHAPEGDTARLLPDGAGGVFAAWADRRDDGGRPWAHPRLQRVSAAGDFLWGSGGVRIDITRDALPTIALSSDPEGILVFYVTDRLRAQRFSLEGERLLGPEGRALIEPPEIDVARDPEVSDIGQGSVYVTWRQTGTAAGDRLMARLVRRDGTFPWPAAVVMGSGSPIPAHRSQTVLPDGALAMAFPSPPDTDPFRYDDLDAQAVDLRGRVKATPVSAPVCRMPGPQNRVRIFSAQGAPAGEPAASLAPEPEALLLWSDARPGVGVNGSDSFFVQRLRFTSSPRLSAPPRPVGVRQSKMAELVLQGDDLQPALTADFGPGVAITATEVLPIDPEGPGDRLRLQFTVDSSARLGGRDLVVLNPDGSRALVFSILSIELDERRIDIDRNGRADGFDLAVLAGAFGRGAIDPEFAPAADFNGDRFVDGADLAFLAGRFGGLVGPE